MDEEIENMVEKFNVYMNKNGVSLDSKHNIAKYMTEMYWEEIKEEGEEEEDIEDEEPDELDTLDDIEEEEPLALPEPVEELEDKPKKMSIKELIKQKRKDKEK